MGLDEERLQRARLVVDELCGNVVVHQREVSLVTLDVTATLDEDGLALDVRDTGEPFDPCGVPPPELDLALADRAIGGWGLHLVRSLCDRFAYCRRNGGNHVHLLLLPAAPRPE